MTDGRDARPGVLPYQALRAAVEAGWIASPLPLAEAQFQPATLDRRLGAVAYQLRASFLPFSQTVQSRLEPSDGGERDLVIDRISLEGGATLQRGSVYLVPLLERLGLPPHVRGRCNPKSTTGRLDIFTRVITDGTPRFDEIPRGYRGTLDLQASPQPSPVRAPALLSLNQLRLLSGETAPSDDELRSLYRQTPLLYDAEDLPIPLDRVVFNDGLCMGLDLSGRET